MTSNKNIFMFFIAIFFGVMNETAIAVRLNDKHDRLRLDNDKCSGRYHRHGRAFNDNRKSRASNCFLWSEWSHFVIWA